MEWDSEVQALIYGKYDTTVYLCPKTDVGNLYTVDSSAYGHAAIYGSYLNLVRSVGCDKEGTQRWCMYNAIPRPCVGDRPLLYLGRGSVWTHDDYKHAYLFVKDLFLFQDYETKENIFVTTIGNRRAPANFFNKIT